MAGLAKITGNMSSKFHPSFVQIDEYLVSGVRCQCSALPQGDEEAGLIEKETEVSYKGSTKK